jgi:hypothetical protein
MNSFETTARHAKVYLRRNGKRLVVKLLAEYLEHVVAFEALAARYVEQADTYRQLATKRAADIGLSRPL